MIYMMKNNEAIHNNYDNLFVTNDIVQSNKEFDIYQGKLFYNLLKMYTYRIRIENDYDRNIKLDITDFKKITRLTTNISFDRIKKTLSTLIDNYLIIEDLRNNKRKVIKIYESITYDKNKLYLTITEDVFAYLYNHANKFTALNTYEINKLTSKFTFTAYEFCCQYRNLNKPYKMPVDFFKRYFSISDSYKSCDIDKLIIFKSLKEINEYTKFDLQIDKLYKGKKISHYVFNIKINKEKQEILKQEEAKHKPKEIIKKVEYNDKNDKKQICLEIFEKTFKENIHKNIKTYGFQKDYFKKFIKKFPNNYEEAIECYVKNYKLFTNNINKYPYPTVESYIQDYILDKIELILNNKTKKTKNENIEEIEKYDPDMKRVSFLRNNFNAYEEPIIFGNEVKIILKKDEDDSIFNKNEIDNIINNMNNVGIYYKSHEIIVYPENKKIIIKRKLEKR